MSNSLISTTVGSILIVSGVVLKNTLEQTNTNNMILTTLGMSIFSIGWIVMAYALSQNKQARTIVGISIACASILISVMTMKILMKQNKTVHIALPIIFAISWIILGFLVGDHLNGAMSYSGLISSIMVILSMMVVLPWQRKNCVVDGPGMPLFVSALAYIIYLNSL